MNDELKSLIEDAAKLLGTGHTSFIGGEHFDVGDFNPCDPERGDLMKVAMAAELAIDFENEFVFLPYWVDLPITFTKGDHQSLALAILRAASAVLHSRGGV